MSSLAQIPALGFKRCTRCHEVKPVEQFGIDQGRKDGRCVYCKPCTSDVAKATASRKPAGSKIIRSGYTIVNGSGWAGDLMHAAKARSIEKGMDFDLTSEIIAKMFETQGGRCYYLEVLMVKSSDNYRDPFKASLDRVDPAKGYTQSNVVMCCAGANLAKNACDPELFNRFVRAIQSARW